MSTGSKWSTIRSQFFVPLALAAGVGFGTIQDLFPSSPQQFQPSMGEAVQALQNSATGRELLTRASALWALQGPSELIKVLRWGETSRTDAVLTRKLDPRTGSESRERVVTVYLRASSSLEDIILDLAHELVHATSRPAWDPYDPALTPGKYIWAALEGEGGEVDAVTRECLVSFELSGMSASQERCGRYLGPGNRIEREKVRAEFYKVGKWYPEHLRDLARERAIFPLLSSEEPRLLSSTGKAPYPVALFREYVELTEVACENSRRRIEVFSEGGRQPAYAEDNTRRLVAARCQ